MRIGWIDRFRRRVHAPQAGHAHDSGFPNHSGSRSGWVIRLSWLRARWRERRRPRINTGVSGHDRPARRRQRYLLRSRVRQRLPDHGQSHAVILYGGPDRDKRIVPQDGLRGKLAHGCHTRSWMPSSLAADGHDSRADHHWATCRDQDQLNPVRFPRICGPKHADAINSASSHRQGHL